MTSQSTLTPIRFKMDGGSLTGSCMERRLGVIPPGFTLYLHVPDMSLDSLGRKLRMLTHSKVNSVSLRGILEIHVPKKLSTQNMAYTLRTRCAFILDSSGMPSGLKKSCRSKNSMPSLPHSDGFTDVRLHPSRSNTTYPWQVRRRSLRSSTKCTVVSPSGKPRQLP